MTISQFELKIEKSTQKFLIPEKQVFMIRTNNHALLSGLKNDM